MATGSSHIRPRLTEKCTVCQTDNPIYCKDAKHYACGKCGALHVYDPARQAFTFLYDNKEAMRQRGKIRPYSEAFLRGTWYRLIGITWLTEKEQQTHWQEYLLIDNQQQIVTLSNYDGIWLMVKSISTHPELPTYEPNEFELDGEWYYLYSHYHTQVDAVQGEVPYDLLEREKVHTQEFLGRERMYIQEDKTIWYTSEYIDAQEVKDGFELPDLDVHSQENHPLRHNPLALPRYYNGFLGVVGILVSLIQLSFIMLGMQKIAFEGNFSTIDPQTGAGIAKMTSPPFIIHEGFWGTKAIELETHAEVENNWVELYYTLINEKTGEEISFAQPVEYYYGYEDGESWAEGDKNIASLLSSVPPSTYRLEIEPITSAGELGGTITPVTPVPVHFSVTVKEDVTIWLNYIIVMTLLVLAGIIHYFRFRARDMKRWELSNLNPYYIEPYQGGSE